MDKNRCVDGDVREMIIASSEGKACLGVREWLANYGADCEQLGFGLSSA